MYKRKKPYHKNWHAISRKVKESQNYKCGKCGRAGRLETHHKDYNPSNNNRNNLVALCRKCHLEIHKPKDKLYQEYLDFRDELRI